MTKHLRMGFSKQLRVFNQERIITSADLEPQQIVMLQIISSELRGIHQMTGLEDKLDQREIMKKAKKLTVPGHNFLLHFKHHQRQTQQKYAWFYLVNQTTLLRQ